jgi:phosphotransferase system enzyme I (PtsI)
MANTSKPIILKGESLSDGVAYSGTCLYKEDLFDVLPRRTIGAEEVSPEQERYAQAIATTRADLAKDRDTVASTISKLEADIFTAHILILEDPAFTEEIKSLVAKDRINAEYAILKVVQSYEEKFKALPNEYFRERIQDINDIAKRLVRNLGVKHSAPLCSSCLTGKPGVMAAELLSASFIAGLYDRPVSGIVTEAGSALSHGAILAKAMGVPVVINVQGLLESLACGAPMLVDGNKGLVIIDPDEDVLRRYQPQLLQVEEKKYSAGYLQTKDGHRVNILANAGSLNGVKTAAANNVKDIGLFRTEFAFLEQAAEPSIEAQIETYRSVINACPGVVTFRLLDLGGDKIADFLQFPQQDNPSLGLRGARVYEQYPNLISHQIEALLRAKDHRPMKLLVPMVSTLKEFLRTRELIRQKLEELKNAHHIDGSNLQIGCMIEVPSAVYTLPSLYEEADFLSIGTNDLIQYIMGVDRNNTHLGDLSSPFQPAVLKVLSEISRAVEMGGKEVVVCGEIASDPLMAQILVGLGYGNLSINIHRLTVVGDALAAYTRKELTDSARNLLAMPTLEHVLDLFARR